MNFKKVIFAFSILLTFQNLAYGNSVQQNLDDIEREKLDINFAETSLDLNWINDELLMVEVKIDSFKNKLLGASFNLKYDNQILKFEKYEPGNFFEKGGDPIYLVKDLENKIVFGSTLKRDDQIVPGQGELVKFFFSKKKKGSFTIEFQNGSLSDLNEIKQDLTLIDWKNIYFDQKSGETITFIGKSEEIIDLTNQKQSENFTSYFWFLIPVSLLMIIITLILKFRFKKRRG